MEYRIADKPQFVRIVHAAGKDFANPAAIAIPWIYSPVALELGLATTANFISWNDAIAADGLLMSLPACIILNRKIAVLLSNDSYDIIKKIFQSMSILLNPFCIYN